MTKSNIGTTDYDEMKARSSGNLELPRTIDEQAPDSPAVNAIKHDEGR